MTRTFRFLLALAVAAFAGAMPTLADISKNPQSAPQGRYDIDPPHAVAMFCIAHFGGMTNYCGWFPKVSGTLQFLGAQPEKSSVEATIDLTKVQTRSDELDQRLRDDFFEVAKFGTATFKSTAVKVTGANQGEITGDLTLHGITKPLTLKATFNGGQPRPIGSGHVIGFSATGTVKLADFNLTGVAWKTFVGDEASLRIEAEFVSNK
jgi:polyisoprenoid-binding protein YceI